MALRRINVRDFRCLQAVEAEFSAGNNLIVGPNASGKTSILEAIGYLGRGKSFRGAAARDVVRRGCDEFMVTAVVERDAGRLRLGVSNGGQGLRIRLDGRDESAAALAEALPLQIIDPEVHALVGGGPVERRRYLDWVGFHVEQGYLQRWRRFQRGLRQRNAMLKAGTAGSALQVWDRELAESGSALHELRRSILTRLAPGLERAMQDLVERDVGLELRSGWREGVSLGEALQRALDRDVATGTTSVGPHRADLVLRYERDPARQVVSRGQQKLLASAMVLGGVELIQSEQGLRALLLLDDPAAELDSRSLGRLMQTVNDLDCQVIATALHPEPELFARSPRVFHVEHGALGAAPDA